jgi:hypothetical protein
MAEDSKDVNSNISHPPVSIKLYRNPISLVGMALAAVAFTNILFLAFLDAFSHVPSPYVGILAFMVAPAIMIVGLVMIPAGMMLERRRRLKAVGVPYHVPRLDLNNPAQRSTAAFLLSFVVIFALMSAVGSYKAYEFTDSIQFCGQLCHSVMSPEYTAYKASPHAKVACVECHVGSGAGWYVKSKLSGLRQVYYTAMGTYPRPIPTPVHDLRPAADTCEQCHWPKKFWGAQMKVFSHYGSDEQNTPRVIRMLIKTGGGDPSLGQSTGGIHWHMNIAYKFSYFATDDHRQVKTAKGMSPISSTRTNLRHRSRSTRPASAGWIALTATTGRLTSSLLRICPWTRAWWPAASIPVCLSSRRKAWRF